MKEIKITEQEQNQRLDKFLLKYFNTAPKSFVYKMLRKKRIKYNGKKGEGNEILQAGDCLQMYLSEETMMGFMEEKTVFAAERHFAIVYEDDDLLVVSKPAGLLVHPEKSSDKETLIDQILYYLHQKGQYQPSKESVFTPAICNRLDRNTSGIVVAGKRLQAVQEVNVAIAKREIKKYYLALVQGEVKEAGVVKGYLAKDSEKNQVSIYQKNGEYRKESITKYRPLLSKEGMTLLEIDLVTGRTHQIRAHMQKIGHPVAGDRKYGDVLWNKTFALSNQFLHAYRMVWEQKGQQWIAPLPKQLAEICRFYFGEDVLVQYMQK